MNTTSHGVHQTGQPRSQGPLAALEPWEQGCRRERETGVAKEATNAYLRIRLPWRSLQKAYFFAFAGNKLTFSFSIYRSLSLCNAAILRIFVSKEATSKAAI